jgi:hypothetical protein
MGMTLLISWMTFATAWIVYFNDVITSYDRYPFLLKILVIVFPVLFALFGIFASMVYVPVIMNGGAYHQEESQKKTNMLENRFDLLSLTVKIFVVAIVFAATSFKPNEGCPVSDTTF